MEVDSIFDTALHGQLDTGGGGGVNLQGLPRKYTVREVRYASVQRRQFRITIKY